MSGHLDAETLAAYREGLLTRRRAARVASHLPGCPRCGDLDAQLADVSALLSAVPPPPMPSALAGRLDAVLADQTRRAATGQDASREAGPVPGRAGSHASGGGRPGRRAGEPRRVLRVVSAAAASAAVVAGGVYGLTQLTGGGGAESPASSSGSAAVPAQTGAGLPGSRSGTHGTGQKAPAGRGRVSGPEAGSLLVIESGTDYLPGHLRAQVTSVLARYPSTGAPAGRAENVPAAVTRRFPRLSGCVRRITGGVPPELVDVARYSGHPAAVIVARPGGTRQVWVVGTGCSASASDVLGHLLLPRAG